MFGVSKTKLKADVIAEVRFDSKGVKGRLVRLPFYFDPLNPEKKMQSTDFALRFAEALTNYEPPGEKRLFDSLTPFRDYSMALAIDDVSPIQVEFRIDRNDAASELFAHLVAAIDEALQSSRFDFVSLRK